VWQQNLINLNMHPAAKQKETVKHSLTAPDMLIINFAGRFSAERHP
jgi:hypothetical protein